MYINQMRIPSLRTLAITSGSDNPQQSHHTRCLKIINHVSPLAVEGTWSPGHLWGSYYSAFCTEYPDSERAHVGQARACRGGSVLAR